MIILTAVTNQLHKIGMPKLSKKIHLRLHTKKEIKINKMHQHHNSKQKT